MTYRTLEEKFLADFEELERENKRLNELVMKLELELAGDDKRNITLDTLVKAEGRRKVFGEAVNSWNVPEVGDRDFGTWCHVYTYEHTLPQGVSLQEFVDYFENEYVAAYEAKMDAEVGE